MADIPLIVVYGDLLWIAVFVAFILLWPALTWRGLRRSGRRWVRAALERLEASSTLSEVSEGGEVTLSERLEAEGNPVERLEDGQPALASTASMVSILPDVVAVSTSSEGLVLVVDGEPVTLDVRNYKGPLPDFAYVVLCKLLCAHACLGFSKGPWPRSICWHRLVNPHYS